MPKLECKIRRANGSQVDVPNADDSTTPYHFKPLDPTREDSPHVAEVAQPHHDHLIRIAPDCYVPFEGKAPKVDLPKPQTITGGSKPQFVPDPGAQPEPATERLSVADLTAGIAAKSFSPEQLRELLAVEEESGEPRKNFVRAITQALK